MLLAVAGCFVLQVAAWYCCFTGRPMQWLVLWLLSYAWAMLGVD